MIKCKIFISSGNGFLDENLFVEILLPGVPIVGTYLQMGGLKDELERKAKSSFQIAKLYHPKWFYGSSKLKSEIEEIDVNDLSFEDAMYICSVTFKANDEYLYIEMTDTNKTLVS
jgi:hypothetical protein